MKKISILLVLLWMGLIFYFSNQEATVSTTQSDKVINFVNVISKNNESFKGILLKLYQLKGASFVIRKSAHIFSYFVLSILSFIMVYTHKGSINLSIKYSFIISILYAISDEIHQLFIPGRSGMIQDVFIDCIGVILGIIFITVIFKLYIKNKKKQVINI